jgi:hypothetical protein
MKIDKALEHFEWKFKNTWKPTPKDIEAYNAIVDYKQQVDDVNLAKNESLAKLWIHQFMLLSNTQMYTAERCIQVINEILSKPVYQWCTELQEQLPIMKFNALTKQGASDEELLEALAWKAKEDDVIRLVNKKITEIIFLYEK